MPQSRRSVQRWTAAAAVAGLALGVAAMAAPAAAASSTFTSLTAPDGRVYKLYRPSGYSAGTPLPLVLMLHGCTQTPDQFATGTQFNLTAEANRVIAVYPQQPSSEQPSSCWDWYDSAQQVRGGKDPASLVGVVADVERHYSVDTNRVYAAGLSAGAAETAVLGATYPDVFAAIDIGSGLEYGAGSNQSSGNTALFSGGPDPVQQGRAAYSAMGSRTRLVPTMIFHGTSDTTVHPVNADQLRTQWATTNDLAVNGGTITGSVPTTPTSTTTGQVPSGRSYTDELYRNRKDGQVAVERYLVNGMGHAWSGGSSSGSYTDPTGPSESSLAWAFFAAHPMPGATPAPSPSPSAPPSPSASPSPTSAPSSTTVVLHSVPGQDGWVGNVPADGISTASGKVGDKGMYNTDTYRTVLSFDTSSVPLGATVTGAVLGVTRTSLSGAVGAISVDSAAGCFGGCALDQADYGAPAAASAVASIPVPAANGSSTSAALSPAGLSSLRLGGTSQLRLRTTTTASFASNVVGLTVAGAGSPPTLTVTYH